MLKAQSARLDRKKLFGDPVMVSTIVVLLIFLALFILYPLAMLLIDSVVSEGRLTLDVFSRVLDMGRFRTAFTNTLELGFIVGLGSTALGLLFAYVDVYVSIPAHHHADQRVCRKGQVWRGLRLRDHSDRHRICVHRGHEPGNQVSGHQQKDKGRQRRCLRKARRSPGPHLQDL